MLHKFLTLGFFLTSIYSASANHPRPINSFHHPKKIAAHLRMYAGSNIGIYIDENGAAKLIKDDMNGLPIEFQDGLKKYKVCLVKFDKVEEGKIEKMVTDSLKKWNEEYEKYKQQLSKDEDAINKKYKPEFDAEDKTKEDAMTKAENTNKTNIANIKNSGKTSVQKTSDLHDENERYKAERETINNKWKDAKKETQKKKDKEINDAKSKKPTPPKLPFEISCAPNPKVDCSSKCEMHEGHIGPTDEKEIVVQKIVLGSIDKFHTKHFYFCTCGKKE